MSNIAALAAALAAGGLSYLAIGKAFGTGAPQPAAKRENRGGKAFKAFSAAVSRALPQSRTASLDAGAALRALCERWGVDVHDPRVADVARRVGADVSFFLDPVPSLFLGAGDMLAETFPALPMPVVLVKPAGDGVSAAAAYGEYDRNPSEPTAYEAMSAALRQGSAEDVRCLAYNNLAPAAKALQPASDDAQRWLASQPETRVAMVSGSGSCVFALCDTIEEAHAVAARAADEQDWWSFATLTVGKPEEVC